MNSKETFHLTTTFLYISLLVIYFQCTSCQPLSESLSKANINNNNEDDSMWIRPLSYLDSDELNNESIDSEELSQLLSKLAIEYKEHDRNNRPSLSSPVRRANFWKRANFWRKRANFWRRDLAL